MIFRRSKDVTEQSAPGASVIDAAPTVLIVSSDDPPHAAIERLRSSTGGTAVVVARPAPQLPQLASAIAVVSLFSTVETLDALLAQLRPLRESRKNGYPVLVVCAALADLASLGSWLSASAAEGRLEGIRLIAAATADDALLQVPSRIEPVLEPNVIKMPASTEVDCKDFKYFYAISPDLRRTVRFMRELAENNITRVYLLGAPGAGKTSLAYYFFLCRGKGNFVSVNLTAESTGDKESMKSLLCGHVTGAFSGASSREGALSFAADGVAFLDESHGVTGVVMQVLMEVLDSGQFLPFGATKKRALDCAVIFASNRSWEALREMMHLDEHARLGATIVKLTNLAAREEDMIAVLAMTLARFMRQCTTWKPARGVTPAAWQRYRTCPWRGNTRTLIRVTETAAVGHASSRTDSLLIDAPHVDQGINLWEPDTHSSMDLYTSIPGDESGIEDTREIRALQG